MTGPPGKTNSRTAGKGRLQSSGKPAGRGAGLTNAMAARLLEAARGVRRRAHAPYSNFLVGAAVLDDRGQIHVGCNVENASYGLSICAERNAVAAAVAAGARRLQAAAVVTDADPVASPCGACRQVLAELATADAPVLMGGTSGPARTALTVRELLPAAFSLR